ncbi:hypothetical protein N8D56_25555 (plasmid) [Devosia sp. A8/3-2]|nr:hypothetical protein N8D56_25555 [Devosia sp. A8/3-2]
MNIPLAATFLLVFMNAGTYGRDIVSTSGTEMNCKWAELLLKTGLAVPKGVFVETGFAEADCVEKRLIGHVGLTEYASQFGEQFKDQLDLVARQRLCASEEVGGLGYRPLFDAGWQFQFRFSRDEKEIWEPLIIEGC